METVSKSCCASAAAAAKRKVVLGLKWLKRKQQSAVEKGTSCD